MSGVSNGEDSVVYAQLNGAYWLDASGGECRWCSELFTGRQASAGAGHGMPGRWGRLRVVILPVAVLTVAAALLVGVLA
ncbi:hypothetical protein [Streptomyces sp. R41]|uniref:Uncharacterized protein n=1 Tax=Streptomyces sp. R41 TaxID=3238632 RepID=A0AB39R7M1_9ACTN